MSELLPAPFGPRSPNMRLPMVSERSFSAFTPFGYVLERPVIVRAKEPLRSCNSDEFFRRCQAVSAMIGNDRQAPPREHFLPRAALKWPPCLFGCPNRTCARRCPWAAQFLAITSLLGPGDELVAASTLYGGTY